MRNTAVKTLTILLLGVTLLTMVTIVQAQPQSQGGKARFEMLTDIDDERRQVELLWVAPDEGEGPWPAILFVHGFQPPEEDEPFAPGAKAMLEVPPRYPLFEMFRQKGFLVGAVSQSGYGNTDGPLDFCGPLSQQAIATAIAALKDHPRVSPDRVFLHGRSRGAVASSVAATRDLGIAGVILESGVYDLKSEHTDLLTRQKEPHHYIAANIELEAGITDEAFIARSVLLTSRSIDVPTLIIHGTEDGNVPATHAVRLNEHLKQRGADVQVVLFEGEGHHVAPEKTAPVIEAFIARALGATTDR